LFVAQSRRGPGIRQHRLLGNLQRDDFAGQLLGVEDRDLFPRIAAIPSSLNMSAAVHQLAMFPPDKLPPEPASALVGKTYHIWKFRQTRHPLADVQAT
jgi:hypothetical protein